MKHNCEYFKKLVSAKMDNEIDANQCRELDQHLFSCIECKLYYDDLRQMQLLTKKVFSEYKSNYSNKSLWANIAGQLTSKDENIIKYDKKRLPFWISSVVAASILIFGLLFLSTNKYSGVQNKCVVEWVESKRSSVMVYEDVSTKTTIIWMLSSQSNTDKKENIMKGAVS